MFKGILNIPKYLCLKDIGVLELVFAFTPMLSGFSFGNIPLSVLMWVVLIVLVFIRNRGIKLRNYAPFTVFVIYWVIHEMIIIFIDDVNLNVIIQQIIFFFSVYALHSYLDKNKLRGSLNWVALVSIAGLIYQWIIIVQGGGVHPLGIPGLSMPENRLEAFSDRPSSFYMEPAAYVAFIICPLALALIDKKYVWAIILILSCFLSTSTTGLILSFVMLGMSLIGHRFSFRTLITIVFIGAGLYYALINSDVFERGVDKYESTDTETNVRLRNGPSIVSTMESTEYIFGVPYSSPIRYCQSGRAPQAVVHGDFVFMSTFWLMILRFGIVGLILYLYVYWRLLRSNRVTLPMITALCAVLFSSSYGIGSTYIFTLCFLLVLVRSYQFSSQHKNKRNLYR